MKEIIHIQAGNVSNHIGTHYFNTLESYFSYRANDGRYVDIDHNVSFREGQAPNGDPTFCPRLMLFDFKSNFGAMPKISDLYAIPSEDQVETWDGRVDINRHPLYERNDYQRALDEGLDDFEPDNDRKKEHYSIDPLSIRYWSDFNRVYHVPRSLHPVRPPQVFHDDGDDQVEIWENGKEAFDRENAESDIMDGDFRLFIEECDMAQGVQTILDSQSFGSFTIAMMEILRDELPKSTTITFANMDPLNNHQFDILTANNCRKVINRAVLLQRLAELSSMTIPLQSASTWKIGPWSSYLDADFTSQYHTSGILSAHVETATLPLRLRSSGFDMVEVCKQLNWRGNTPFAHLSGALPAPVPLKAHLPVSDVMHDFSVSLDYAVTKSDVASYAQWNVIRGFNEDEQSSAHAWLKSRFQLPEFLMRSTWTRMAYPLPTSFPQFFKGALLTSSGRRNADVTSYHPTHTTPSPRLTTIPVFTCLQSSPSLASLFRSHATFISTFLSKGGDVRVLGPAFGREEVKELCEDMIKLGDAFAIAGGESYNQEDDDGQAGDDFGDD